MADISSPHDSFFRSILADKQVAIDYFKSALPAHISQKLDFSTLERSADSYISAELEKSMSDAVFDCQRLDGKGSVEVSLLVEHKSYPDRYTPVQIGGYLFSGYQHQIKQGRVETQNFASLTPIIPILFYHGKKKWEYTTLQQLFSELDQEIFGFIPEFQYVYNDITSTPDEDIEAISNKYLAMSLKIMKHSSDVRWMKANLPLVLAMGLLYGSDEQQFAALVYSFSQVDLTEEQIKEMIRGLPLKIQDSIMSTYDLLIEKGRIEERAKAQRIIEQERAKAEQERANAYAEKRKIALEFKNLGVAIADIAKGTGLSTEEIEKL